jgi:metal-responsive CopG/Arc/MetJ family transcriptional regulator
MKTAISIPDLLFEAAEAVASRLGISRSELYRRALDKYLQDRSRQVIRERLDEVYGSDSDDGRLDPAIEFIQGEALQEDEW